MAGEPDRSSLSRRQTLKRGAALSGALLWATPTLQSLTMRPAFAQATPVPGAVEGPSFIAMNVMCPSGDFHIKLECNATCDWEEDPGRFPDCDEGPDPVFTPEGKKADGGALGFEFIGPDPVTGCVTVIVPLGCTVLDSAIKGGVNCPCSEGGTGLVFCPPC